VAVAIVPSADGEPTAMESRHSGHGDVRNDWLIGRSILGFPEAHRARSVVLSLGILGCPREEEVDEPLGAECSRCPYWREKDRWAGTGGWAPSP
jgi:hypothetical protein